MNSDEERPVVVVSADSHAGPRLIDDLRQYCPAKYLDEFDRFAADWFAPTDVIEKLSHPNQVGAIMASHPNFATAGHYDSAARLADYDYDGIAAGVIFHGSQNQQPIPFVPTVYGGSFDQELAAVGKQIYNRWLADFVAQAPHRHIGLAELPMWDIEQALAELKRAYDTGLRGINFPAVREGVIPEYNNRAWEPLWTACAERGMPLATHVAGGTNARYQGLEGSMLTMMEPGGWMARRAIWWLIFAGVFERHPSLDLVITETPGNWWPSTATELDSIYDFTAHQDSEMLAELFDKQLPRHPSEYMADHVYFGASFAAPFEAEQAVLNGVENNLLWGSDYPHVEGTFVYPKDIGMPSVTRLALRNTFHDIKPETTRRMLGENAIKVFNLDGEALQGIANRIGAPTPAELAKPIDATPDGASQLAFRSQTAWT